MGKGGEWVWRFGGFFLLGRGSIVWFVGREEGGLRWMGWAGLMPAYELCELGLCLVVIFQLVGGRMRLCIV